MSDLSKFRLYLLRAAYLVIAIGLAMLGVRYPIRMLPLLLFEFTWKLIRLIAIALPLWRADQVDAATAESIKACAMGVIICAVAIPWPYAFAKFLQAPADRYT